MKQTRRHPKLSRMTTAFLFIATVIFGIVGILGSPAIRDTNNDIVRASAALQKARDVHNVWACIVASAATGKYGYGYGDSHVQALALAEGACTGDCSSQLCVTGGCVVLATGPKWTELSWASGHGTWQNDVTQAENDALTTCRANLPNCKITVGVCTSNAH